MTRRRERVRAGRARPTIPSTSLSAIDAVTSVNGPAARNGRRSSSAWRERRGPGRVVGAVEQDVDAVAGQQLQPARPAARSRSRPGARSRHVRDPGLGQRVEQGVGDRRVRGLVPPAQADRGPAEPRQLDLDAVARHPDASAGSTTVSGTPIRVARRRMIASASPVAPGHREVAALDDRRLLAGDVRRSSARGGPCGRGRRW